MEGLLPGSGIAFVKQGLCCREPIPVPTAPASPCWSRTLPALIPRTKERPKTMGEEGLREDRAARKAGKSS